MRAGAARTALLASVMLAAVPAGAATIVVPGGTTDTSQKTVGGFDIVTVQSGGTLSSPSNPAINWSTASTGLIIANSGTIQSTGNGGRVIGTSGSATQRSITLTNNAGALIQSQDDAVRINTDVTGGTILVNNAGTIRTTGGGQAIDFDAIASTGATIRINNLAGGTIQSFGQDAIRSGQGAIIDNAGTIFADGALGNSYDGIDMQAHTATVTNEAAGTISGLRHGVTSNSGLTVTNYGSITGRNGSGVGSDGNGTVANFGTITGAYDGSSANGDGDGVDIDFIGTVTNSGVIQGTGAHGVDSGGQPNSSEGIAMGGGTIVNNAGALVSGAGRGILIDDGSGGAAAGATTITNAGTIRGLAGPAITLVGNFDDSIINSGAISGANGVAIEMGAGNDTLTLLPGSIITGSVDGGAGTDLVRLAGAGSGSFAGARNFERLDVVSGSWSLTGASIFPAGTTIAAGAALTGSAATLTGAIADAGTLTVDQPRDALLTAQLSGAGSLVKAGVGTLLIEAQPFTGATAVAAGVLQLAGTLPSAVTVGTGAALAGTGGVASATVQSGGTIAPGALAGSIGRISTTGGFVQQTGSTYAADVTQTAAGASDSIVVGGAATIQTGTTLALTRGPGSYGIGTRYTLLTATGGITGTYTTVAQAISGNTELRVVQNGSSLFADVARTGASLLPLAQTPNQRAVAAAFAALGAGNAAYAALTLNPSDGAVAAGFDALSGEVHASLRTAIAKDVLLVQGAATSRIEDGAAARGGLWAQLIGNRGEDDAGVGVASADRRTIGGVGGFDLLAADGIRAGVAGGYTRTRLTVDDRASRARVGTAHVLAYVGGSYGALRIDAGAGYAWSKLDTRRTVASAGFTDSNTARYDGNTLHAFGQIGYAIPLGGGTVEPFVGGSALRIHTDRFGETGGAAALDGAAHRQSVEFSTAGLNIATPVVATISVRASATWQHAFDAVRPDAILSFAGGAVPFAITGAALSRDAAVPTADIVWQATPKLRMAAGYAGLIGRNGQDNAARLTLSLGL